jgi:16S rRNA (guanine966-N2)-methyltransferase
MMVERDSKAAAVCIKNSLLVQKALEKAGSDAATKVVNKSVQSFLNTGDEYKDTFDLAFIDPPYEISNSEISENLAALIPLLRSGAIIVVERSSRSGEFEIPVALSRESQKNYGDTEIFWLRLG